MIGKREEIPYDEDGKQLSFSTDAETVYVDGVPLKTWLSRLEAKLTEAAKGQDGNSFGGFQTDYAAVSDQDNSLDKVKLIVGWSPTSPALTVEKPHLWKRVQTKLQSPSGEVSITNVDYEYCGSLGATGLDAEWKEWIFRLTDNKKSEIEMAGILQDELKFYYDSDKNSPFQQNDFIPTYWNDDMQTVTDEHTIQWCASRYKKNGVWSEFGNVHVFGRKPLDAVTVNNIYAITQEVTEDCWDEDKGKFKDSLFLDRDSGIVSGFPSGTHYDWKDSIPNAPATAIIYQASVYFQGETYVGADFPVRITGPAGVGSDGTGIEFVYCVSDSEKYKDTEDNENNEGTEGTKSDIYNLPKFYPSEKHYTSSGGWFDTAGECPISPNNPYQFMRQRLGQYVDDNNWYWWYKGKKYGKTPTPNPSILDPSQAPEEWNYGWSEPVLWSSWGTDGVDGDGVQYVYVRLTEAEYQFVSKDINRWNFDGGDSEVDPGDISDPSNPNNPINYKYEYVLDKDEYTSEDLVSAYARSIRLYGISGHYTIKNGNNEVISSNKPFNISFTATLNSNDFNISKNDIKDCTQRITYNGPSLPENDSGLGSITFTLHFKRDKAPDGKSLYTVFYYEGDADNYTDIPPSLCPNGSNPNIIRWDGSEQIVVKAPEITGYTINSENELTVSETNTVLAFYYTKNQ